MTNCIFYLVMFAYFVNFAFGSINYFGVNRSFTLLYKGVIENACQSVDESGNPIKPYFDKDELIYRAEEYFASTLPRYVTSYDTNYYFFNLEDKSYCTGTYCRGVKISLRAKINIFYTYEKAREFYVTGD